MVYRECDRCGLREEMANGRQVVLPSLLNETRLSNDSGTFGNPTRKDLCKPCYEEVLAYFNLKKTANLGEVKHA